MRVVLLWMASRLNVLARGLVTHSRSHLMVRGGSRRFAEGIAKGHPDALKAISWVAPSIALEQVASVDGFEGDVLLVPVFKAEEEKFEMNDAMALVDGTFDGALSELLNEESFEAKPGASTVMRMSSSTVKRVAALVVGKENGRSIGKKIAELSKNHKAKRIGVVAVKGMDLEALVTSCLEACYVDNRFRTGDSIVEPANIAEIVVVGYEDEEKNKEENTDVVFQARGVAAGVAFARDITNAPANVVTPKSLAEASMKLTEQFSDVLSGKVLDNDECAKRGMGAYLGVAQGAILENQAHFIHLTYKGPSSSQDAKRARLSFVGKGLTYDSGGYNLKPSSGGMIEKMKMDCGGSAAVLGAARALAELKVADLDVDFIVAACENMVSAEAMRPGDILTASNGKTIEVINTDAEGRLTLADALVYAERECEPDAIVDLATLTGAMIVALGDNIAGLFTPHDDLATEILSASHLANEKLWRMPLETDYEEAITSKIADLKNVGGRAAGSITAGLFLKHFVSKDLPWCHLDIAGPAFDHKQDVATGYGVKTLVTFAKARAKQAPKDD